MRRQSPKEQQRARILDDDEPRIIWKAAAHNGVFGGIVRVSLLTAQRRAKVTTMRWSDITLDGEWRILTEAREKGNAGSLILPLLALEVINAQPRMVSNPYIFAGVGTGPFRGFVRAKSRFDRSLPTGFAAWTIHDCRRTARSLMSRAGVRPDIAERVMGHAIVGVEGIYDRHEYRDEKADALRRLAGLIESIVNPPADKVVRIPRAAR
jgi:integrase